MSDARTPTYDQLSALCAQLAAALNAWMVFSNADDPAYKARWEVRGRVDTVAALTAYRTLSPDPVYAEAKAMFDGIEALLSAGCPLTPQISTLAGLYNKITSARGEG